MNKMYGWAGQLLRVDLTTGEITKEALSKEFLKKHIGGRGLSMQYLYDEVGPDVDPKGPDNKLILAVGPFTGTPIGSSRMNVLTKSPQTGFINDGNIGGFVPAELRFAGYDVVIIQGRADHPVYLFINDDEVTLRDASHIWGKTTSMTQAAIQEELEDNKIRIMGIGPAGEHKAINSIILGDLYHSTGRGGAGAVMGDKNLKAIAVRGTGSISVKDPDGYFNAYDEWWRELDPEQCPDLYYRAWGYAGDAFIVDFLKAHDALTTRNDQEGIFEGKDDLGSVFIRNNILRPQACYACPMPSCTQLLQYDGKAIKVHAGTMMSLGSNFGISDQKKIMELHTLCNDLGIDNYAALTISWAVEAYMRGVLTKEDTDGMELKWGDAEMLRVLLTKLAYRDGFGTWLADGSKAASEHFGGTEYAMQVKGLETTTVTARAMWGMGLAYAVNDTGADHCRTYPPYPPTPDAVADMDLPYDINRAVRRDSADEKGKLIKWSFDSRAALNALELCTYCSRGRIYADFTVFADAVTAMTGEKFTTKDLDLVGERICNLERSYNVLNGNASRKDDSLPKRFTHEAYAEGGSAGLKIPLDVMLDDYYDARNWDKATGRPTREKLEELGLDFVVRDFEKKGVFKA